MYKTLAELKRALVPGTKLNLVQTLLGPCDKLRTVKQVRSKDMILTTEDGHDSYCTFPEAKNYIPLHSGFQFIEDGTIAVHYIFI